MLLTVDLTARQAARILERAVRRRAVVELEARNRSDAELLRATVIRLDGGLICAELAADCGVTPLDLIGAFCEARMSLGGDLFFFTVCALDVPDGDLPNRILLSRPEVVQVANRRRYERTNATIASQARVYPLQGPDPAAPPAGPLVGLVESVSASGLSCVLPGAGADEALLVGDTVNVQFELGGITETFELHAVICTKRVDEQQQLRIGLEFCPKANDAESGRRLEHFRATLAEISNDLFSTEGES